MEGRRAREVEDVEDKEWWRIWEPSERLSYQSVVFFSY